MKDAWLAHYGIKEQKWGVRRFQNPDGTLTEAGKKRYGSGIVSDKKPKKPIGTIEENPQKTRPAGAIEENPKKVSHFERRKMEKEAARQKKEAEAERKRQEKEAKKQHKQEVKEINKAAKARDKEWDEQRTTMSDKDLDAVLSRKRKEQELHKMTNEGSAFTKTVMTDVGKKVLTTVIAGAALYGAKIFCENVLGNADLGNAVFPGGAKKKKDKGDD